MSDNENKQVSRYVDNPFGSSPSVTSTIGALANAEQQKAIAEVQARMIIARANPRHEQRSVDTILRDCTRETLAEKALYSYARGGSDITGPSIRLMEAIAQRWGNIASGIKEVSRSEAGYSECVAYAWDLESGYYDERQFQVRHWRDTKKGGYRLTDERDIYELIANMGQRRKRAVLISVIPGDVIEAAQTQCEETLHAQADTSPAALQKIAKAFEEFGVTREQIEARIQRKLEAIRPAQVVQLRKIFQSLKDEMSEARDWFEPTDGARPAQTQGGAWQQVQERHAASAAQQRQAPPTKQQVREKMQSKNGPPPANDEPNRHPRAATDEDPAMQSENPAPADDGSAHNNASGDATSAEPGFDYYLLDEIGEPVGDTSYLSPWEWASAFADRWLKSDNREALDGHNADAMEDAKAMSPDAAKTLADLTAPPAGSEEQQDASNDIAIIPVPAGRDGPNWPQYLKDIKAALPAQTKESIYDFIATQAPQFNEATAQIRLLVVKAIAERCREVGMDPPVGLGTVDKDQQTFDRIVAEMQSVTSIDALKAFSQRGDVSTPYQRWKREKEHLANNLQAAFDARKKALAP